VYRFIGERQLRGGSSSPELGDPWTDDLIARAYREAEESMRAILDYLAARPDQRVPAKDLVTVLRDVRENGDATKNPLPGVMGGFANRVANVYGLRNGRGNAILPFRNPRDRSVKS